MQDFSRGPAPGPFHRMQAPAWGGPRAGGSVEEGAAVSSMPAAVAMRHGDWVRPAELVQVMDLTGSLDVELHECRCQVFMPTQKLDGMQSAQANQPMPKVPPARCTEAPVEEPEGEAAVDGLILNGRAAMTKRKTSAANTANVGFWNRTGLIAHARVEEGEQPAAAQEEAGGPQVGGGERAPKPHSPPAPWNPLEARYRRGVQAKARWLVRSLARPGLGWGRPPAPRPASGG